ncbi:MAG: hypothetical protein IJA44_01970 [Clostridia bacterium]|nr:hypothetical protein [Clostridia bacterium]
MKSQNVWDKAQSVKLNVTENISPLFNICFDKKIPQDIKNELISFVNWVENNYSIPITLWVDFEYKHYLIRRDGKRVGYLFYWSDFSDYPNFDNENDIPYIRLPVRTEQWSIEEILTSFIEAIFDYYAWICNEIHEDYILNENNIEEVLQKYLRSKEE